MRKRAYKALLFSITVFVLVSGLLVPNAGQVHANGKPIKIVLTYLEGLSNAGPIEATGLVEVVMKEGQVNVGVVGLPPLADETYTGWIVNTASGAAMNVGSFNTDQSEVAKYRVELPEEIPDTGWNLFLVTLETNGQNAKSPGARKSIGGYFPEPAAAATAGPAQLPRTGGNTNPEALKGSQPTTKVLMPQNDFFGLNNNFLSFGVVAVVAFGLGILAKSRRK